MENKMEKVTQLSGVELTEKEKEYLSAVIKPFLYKLPKILKS